MVFMGLTCWPWHMVCTDCRCILDCHAGPVVTLGVLRKNRPLCEGGFCFRAQYTSDTSFFGRKRRDSSATLASPSLGSVVSAARDPACWPGAPLRLFESLRFLQKYNHPKLPAPGSLFLRKRRDSNSRYLAVCRLSKAVHSATMRRFRTITNQTLA